MYTVHVSIAHWIHYSTADPILHAVWHCSRSAMYRANSNCKMSCNSQSEMLNNACRTHIHVLTNNEPIKDIDL